MQVTIHKTYRCCHRDYTTQSNEILAVVDYWEHKTDLRKNVKLAREAVTKTIEANYGKNVFDTGETVLNVPKLIMKFKIS